jgi:radical SAM superfamily enzyme YgiQ (UPF0313 family)
MLQPQIGPLIAALLPDEADVDVVNDTWTDPDWSRSYDLVFLSCMHSDFDRARQIGHYYRRRGAATVLGGIMASTFTHLCAPWFDAIVIGDPEDTVRRVYADAKAGRLQPVYRSAGFVGKAVPTPRVAAAAAQQWFPLALEATRGCPYTCDFCALTAAGPRFGTRPVSQVVADLHRMRSALHGLVRGVRGRLVVFYDNNIGGNLRYLRELCDALQPLDLEWVACVTFNVIASRDLLKRMYDAGCRGVYVGLETFNPKALVDFHKPQNKLSQVREALVQAREEGILVAAGLLLSPVHDDPEYIRSLPERLSQSGLHVPSFLCFEAPIPGTPFFNRLAQQAEPALLPYALLRDFTGYTLVARPQRCSPEEFVQAYREVLREIYRPLRRFGKLLDDLPRLLRRGSWTGAGLDIGTQWLDGCSEVLGRTYLAGSDLPPPECVPFSPDDFTSEAERLQICSPTMVTDGDGRVLPAWQRAHTPRLDYRRDLLPLLTSASTPEGTKCEG